MPDVMMNDTKAGSSVVPATKAGALRRVVLVLVIAAAAMSLWSQRDQLTLTKLAVHEDTFRQFQTDHPVLVYLIMCAAYVVVTGLSLPGAAAMTLLIGWMFGFWAGFVVVSFSSTAGATAAFLLSRYLFREAIVQRFGDRLDSFNKSLERQGAFYLFTLRLIPAVPFFVINAVMGLTTLPVRTFWWVSQLGMLAGTAVYVYAGSSVPKLQTLADQGVGAVFTATQLLQLFFAFALLGIFPLIVRLLMTRTGRPSS
ncbi:MAG: TVP38/TMEM64 family protein [Planctomycetaceae bacterium]|nr:TVP38/TMEM64 family protein [Planctomycetaceae bacterium]